MSSSNRTWPVTTAARRTSLFSFFISRICASASFSVSFGCPSDNIISLVDLSFSGEKRERKKNRSRERPNAWGKRRQGLGGRIVNIGARIWSAWSYHPTRTNTGVFTSVIRPSRYIRTLRTRWGCTIIIPQETQHPEVWMRTARKNVCFFFMIFLVLC